MARSRFTSTEEVFEYLLNFVNVEKGQKTEFKLDRMLYLAALLGNPQAGRLTIHVAGSKGKGSVSTMCANILHATGLRVGLYTSPHILRWKERIAFAENEMPEDLLIGAMEEVLPLVEGRSPDFFPGDELPTYFELTTLVAFCAFRASGCGAQVIETGLGGRLDSTNIVDPDVSVITPIELEHTQFLGDTISKIAFEKAGIIKAGKPVCVAVQKPEALEVFEAKAKAMGSSLYRLGKDIDFDGVRIDADGTNCRIFSMDGILPAAGLAVHCPMIGAIQAQNMALAALATVSILQGSGDVGAKAAVATAIRKGLAKSTLPARFELAGRNPAIVLDGAHTPESVHLAMDTMTALFPGPKVLLFACAYDKRHEEMAAILAPHFNAIVVTKPGDFKVSDPKAVFESFMALRPDSGFEEDTRMAMARAIAEAERRGASLLVTGSFYLCAEAKGYLATRGSEGSGSGL
ncbi:MAG: folylpolyglutamate synthase/dihydrofolate synthase family protein [Rectinemataceae bacterium]|nr:folylpolyglutamate synthase/dihydrofolate synthase family protein [Rectinemataceae bacterium]